MYGDDVPRTDTGRRISSADVERHGPPSSLTRSDLSWRALLCGRETLPPLEPLPPRSSLLDAQGIAVFRRSEGRAYVALDYGHSGGGHGHPDRLNLLLSDGDTRWLDDYGTGSYVDPSLHWYRSTLAHNAPMVDGASQRTEMAFSSHTTNVARGMDLGGGRDFVRRVATDRAIVAMSEYVIDTLTWRSEREVTVDLPVHADIVLDSEIDAPRAAALVGGEGTEDGFRFAHDTTMQRVPALTLVHGSTSAGANALRVWHLADRECEWWRAVAPGAPSAGDHAFRVIRAKGLPATHLRHRLDGRHRKRCDRRGNPCSPMGRFTFIDATTTAGTSNFTPGRAQRDRPCGRVAAPASSVRRSPRARSCHHRSTSRARRRTQRPFDSRSITIAGQSSGGATPENPPPTSPSGGRAASSIAIDVHRVITFAAANAVNAYDNEFPDINGDGVQLYLSSDKDSAHGF